MPAESAPKAAEIENSSITRRWICCFVTHTKSQQNIAARLPFQLNNQSVITIPTLFKETFIWTRVDCLLTEIILRRKARKCNLMTRRIFFLFANCKHYLFAAISSIFALWFNSITATKNLKSFCFQRTWIAQFKTIQSLEHCEWMPELLT